jgi:hypothetical protein
MSLFACQFLAHQSGEVSRLPSVHPLPMLDDLSQPWRDVCRRLWGDQSAQQSRAAPVQLLFLLR